MTTHAEMMLGGFHHRVARWLMGEQPRRLPDDRWEHPHPTGRGDEGGRVGGGGDIHKPDTVHGRAIYCDAANSGSVLGFRATAES